MTEQFTSGKICQPVAMVKMPMTKNDHINIGDIYPHYGGILQKEIALPRVK